MRVLAWPAFKNKNENPYNWLLSTHLVNIGVMVEEFSINRLVQGKFDILHINWPDAVLNNKNRIIVYIKSLILLIILISIKMRGTKILWTVHNLHSHENYYPRFEKWYMSKFISLIDGHISLSEEGKKALLNIYPILKRMPGFVVPHGNYREIYPNKVDRDESRIFLDIPLKAKVVSFVGQIRPYKNLEKLIKVFKEISDENVYLLVAGKPSDVQLGEIIKYEASKFDKIILFLDFIPDNMLQIYVNASDLMIFPYGEILNSGSAFMALTFNCPIMVPSVGAFKELKDILGGNYVITYDGELTAEKLVMAIKEITKEKVLEKHVLEEFEWNKIAPKVLNVYKYLLKSSY
ncbi:glycosyl transferase group 1 [Desulfocucumis palustris]|uniref:Glycosyl transferase group 1 n=1 Tax=Desulfocucumis palustris TaxID=1898651 RepID=A0A2L2XCE8_9FIRM|nr:glycosyltransferase family 4 protein [Desulfocucumis palustris]GBF33918.1 glycosyl transferase group 1 [Desulfocucumis palustris]